MLKTLQTVRSHLLMSLKKSAEKTVKSRPRQMPVKRQWVHHHRPTLNRRLYQFSHSLEMPWTQKHKSMWTGESSLPVLNPFPAMSTMKNIISVVIMTLLLEMTHHTPFQQRHHCWSGEKRFEWTVKYIDRPKILLNKGRSRWSADVLKLVNVSTCSNSV